MLPAQISSPRRLTSPKAAALHASHGIAHGAAQRGLSPAVEADVFLKISLEEDDKDVFKCMYVRMYVFCCVFF